MTREEAIEIIKRNCINGSLMHEACEILLPELFESEDERIRKRIRLCLEECVHSDIIRDYERSECIAYLKRQKEQKPDDDPLDVPKFTKGFDTGREVQRIFDEQKPAEWSEEDKKPFKNVLDGLKYAYEDLTNHKSYDSAKDVKDAYYWMVSRFQNLQPKQEWSEEDEDFINMLILHFNYMIDKEIKEGGPSVETYKSYREKLKSLKPRPHWKPSEKQMGALLWCCAHLGGADHTVLAELYEHLLYVYLEQQK